MSLEVVSQKNYKIWWRELNWPIKTFQAILGHRQAMS